MDRGVSGTHVVSGGLISLLGAVLAAVVLHDIHVDVVVQNDPLYTTLLENALPLAVNAIIIGAGYWLATEKDPTIVRQTLIWTGLSVAGLLFVALWVYGFQFIQSEIKPLVILGQIASMGAVAGIVIGLYSGRQKRRQRRLEMLYQASGELMSAETPDVVARRGVDAACNTLGLSIAAVFLESRGVLEPVASSEQATEPCGDPDPVTARESMAWEIHESETPATATNPDQARSIWSEDCSCDVSAALLVPLSGHGILFIGAQPDDSFDDETRALAQILGSNIETTLDRVAKEQDLRDREQELAQQNERLESFTSVVSHDLRNPLSVAKGYAEIAKEETESDAVGRIDRSLNRMDTLIEDLLTMARQGETIDELEPMDLEHVARDAWSTVKTGAATLRVDGNMEFEGDPNRSRQLLENLFRNAVEHGGMDVTVTVGSLGDDGIFIEDTGSGIPLEDRGAVFEQGYTTTETGTGFGLAIVETIVNAHDGSATVTKGREGGARFEITGLDAGDG